MIRDEISPLDWIESTDEEKKEWKLEQKILRERKAQKEEMQIRGNERTSGKES